MDKSYQKTRNIALEDINRAWREYIKSEHKHEDSISDTEEVDFEDISIYEVMATRLQCLEMAIKFYISEIEWSDTKIIGLAEKFEQFVLKDIKLPED